MFKVPGFYSYSGARSLKRSAYSVITCKRVAILFCCKKVLQGLFPIIKNKESQITDYSLTA